MKSVIIVQKQNIAGFTAKSTDIVIIVLKPFKSFFEAKEAKCVYLIHG